MTQKELAALLGVSGAMVSKLAKRGMPTDSVERARRWRKRHLEPGRIKGSRFDPTKEAPNPVNEPQTVGRARLVDAVEKLAQALAPQIADPVHAASLPSTIAVLRDAVRELPPNAKPLMPVGVWVALVDHVLNEKSPVRHFGHPDRAVTPQEFARLVNGDATSDAWLSEACDWHDYAITGLPEDED